METAMSDEKLDTEVRREQIAEAMTRRKTLVAFGLLVVAALALAYSFGLGNSGDIENNTGSLLSRIGIALSRSNGNVIRVSGNIELVDVEVSFKIPGRVIERTVDEGELVEAGKRIAVLESEDLRKDVAVREAAFRVAEAVWEEVDNGSREEEKNATRAAMEKADEFHKELQNGSRPQEVKAAEATLQSAQVERARLSEELERAKKLYFENHVLSEEDYARQEAAYRVADAKWRETSERALLVKLGPRDEQKQQAKAALEQATWQYRLVKAGARSEVRKQTQARLDEARAAWELAKTRLNYAEVFAPPWRGVVLSKNVEPGEYVAPGTPVVTVGDLAHPWLRAYIDEPDLTRVKYGQRARVTTGRNPGRAYEGWVGFISSEAEFTPKNVQTEKERTKLVYRIKIYVDNRDLELKRGMPADAEILLDSTPVKPTPQQVEPATREGGDIKLQIENRRGASSDGHLMVGRQNQSANRSCLGGFQFSICNASPTPASHCPRRRAS
jgi:HlyD family secretion protein